MKDAKGVAGVGILPQILPEMGVIRLKPVPRAVVGGVGCDCQRCRVRMCADVEVRMAMQDLSGGVSSKNHGAREVKAVQPLRLSDVLRRSKAAAVWMLLLGAGWLAGVFAVIALVQPLMVGVSDWWGVLIVAYLFLSTGVCGYLSVRIHRWMKLCCPFCGAAFVYLDLPHPTKSAEVVAEEERHCGFCHAVMIDMDK